MTDGNEAEPTVQQEETPQPPPPKPPDGTAGEWLFPCPDEQQKDDILFFTSSEPHCGHFVPLFPQVMLCRTENLSRHFKQSYSYIGMFPPGAITFIFYGNNYHACKSIQGNIL